MFCPRCGHEQVSNELRFCSRCGMSIGLVTDLITDSSNQLKRERRELNGVALMMATVLMLVNFTLVFGAITLPHLTSPALFWVWLAFVISSLSVGGYGLVNLIRGGFFKRLKDYEVRLKLLKSEQAHQKLIEKPDGGNFDARSLTRAIDQASVTETTTRELQGNIKSTNEFSN